MQDDLRAARALLRAWASVGQHPGEVELGEGVEIRFVDAIPCCGARVVASDSEALELGARLASAGVQRVVGWGRIDAEQLSELAHLTAAGVLGPGGAERLAWGPAPPPSAAEAAALHAQRALEALGPASEAARDGASYRPLVRLLRRVERAFELAPAAARASLQPHRVDLQARALTAVLRVLLVARRIAAAPELSRALMLATLLLAVEGHGRRASLPWAKARDRARQMVTGASRSVARRAQALLHPGALGAAVGLLRFVYRHEAARSASESEEPSEDELMLSTLDCSVEERPWRELLAALEGTLAVGALVVDREGVRGRVLGRAPGGAACVLLVGETLREVDAQGLCYATEGPDV